MWKIHLVQAIKGQRTEIPLLVANKGGLHEREVLIDKIK